MVGVPYTDADIAGAAAAVEGKTELDALIAYLQGLGTNAQGGKLSHGHRHVSRARSRWRCCSRSSALVFWAYSKRRKADFDEMARCRSTNIRRTRNKGARPHDYWLESVRHRR